ncbi:MAG: KamA family radical SAM protein [Proteobacteria bacterium]|nr:KamA family radical SAM protein [Pseudomonadota bacterium]MBU1742999.1 KamA family radical SAM protein [Pseudomonadota bacterium]
MKPNYVQNIDAVAGLDPAEREALRPVADRFEFGATDYYLSLIDWDDPADPIRRIIIPDLDEMERWGLADPSSEASYTVLPGLQHKYPSTAVLLVSDLCGGRCRFCFRKRLFFDRTDEVSSDEVSKDVGRGIAYIREHTEVNNVLLTGGDSLMRTTPALTEIIEQLRSIDHVRIVRLGTKMPAFNPWRILDDKPLLELAARFSRGDKRLYFMIQFNHWRELTEPAREAISLIQRTGSATCQQTPLIRGVNDDPMDLARLWSELSFLGVASYYIFQCRPTLGNRTYAVPIEESYRIVEAARGRCSGLAKRARFVMSHARGKIEVVGLADGQVFMRFHRAPGHQDRGRFLIFPSNPQAYWLDDYTEPIYQMGLRRLTSALVG